MNALFQHLLLTLKLNFRSKQAMAYGYLVPVFFLLAFGSIFRSGVPPLVHEMGQLLTITVLGGACFGMPTTMVNEREKGVWRRYRLLPMATAGLILSAMVARYIIVLIAAVMQIALAWCFYRTPMPAHPGQLLVAFTFVCFAFLGMGLVIAMLADSVPAVQALGQAIFLPMIMIGGVGVPLSALPAWAQHVAGFLPGRYAVEALQSCIQGDRHGLAGGKFALLALTVTGLAACLAGAKMFRWDTGQKMSGRSKEWVLVALAAWAAVGLAAWRTNRLDARTGTDTGAAVEKWQRITDADLNAITYNDLPEDDGEVVPFASNLDNIDPDTRKQLDAVCGKLAGWEPGRDANIGQRVRNLLNVCAIADMSEDRLEADIPYVVLEQLKQDVPAEELKQALGWVILYPKEGNVVTEVPALGIDGKFDETVIRERCALYGKKFLLRLLNKQAKTPG
jgi:ABC-type polysaccharide/polyol phosphate export permease